MVQINPQKYQTNSTKKQKNERREFSLPQFSLFSKGLSDKLKQQFYSDISTLLAAGLNIDVALNLLLEEEGKLSSLYGKIKTEILTGKSLHKAFKDTGYFDPYEYYSIKIGEEGGKVPEVLEKLQEHYSAKSELKRQIIGALTYPVIIVLISFGVLTFLMNYTVPLFSGVLEQLDIPLPKITVYVTEFSKYFQAVFKPIIFTVLSVSLIFYLSRNALWFKKGSAKVLKFVPVFGELTKRIHLSRLCDSMSTLIQSNVPLVKALEMNEEMINFHPLKITLADIRVAVLKGKPLYEAFEAHSIYERRFVSMIRIGEEVNQLGKSFQDLSLSYRSSVDHQTKVMKSLMEPLIIIFVGAVVGIVALSMILPIFELSSKMEF
jgi:type IV pilus assembly protein PilC